MDPKSEAKLKNGGKDESRRWRDAHAPQCPRKWKVVSVHGALSSILASCDSLSILITTSATPSGSMGDALTSSKELKLVPLSNQVAGHVDGVQSLEGGRLVVKACLARELEFYKQVKQAAAGEAGLEERQVELLSRLAKRMPECHGSWEEYTGRQAGSCSSTQNNESGRIVMENLTYGYEKPNVCDIKLGTQLWDEDANEEKRQRMEKVAAHTTSGSHGIRLTGWQVRNSLKNRQLDASFDAYSPLAFAPLTDRHTIRRPTHFTAYQRRSERRSRWSTWNWGCACFLHVPNKEMPNEPRQCWQEQAYREMHLNCAFRAYQRTW